MTARTRRPDPLRADAAPVVRRAMAALTAAVVSAGPAGRDALDVADEVAAEVDASPRLLDALLAAGHDRGLWRVRDGRVTPR